MCLLVDVEVDAVDRSTWVLVLENTLCTITEWDDRKSLCTYRNRLCQIVHLAIRNTLWSNCTLNPSVQDTCPVDAEKHTETCVRLVVVYVSKCVYARELVVVYLTEYTIYNT